MSHWNYRLCKNKHERSSGNDVTLYSIREVYYNDDGEIWGLTDDGISVYGDSDGFDNEQEILDDMKGAVKNMLLAFEKPVIDLDTIEYADPPFATDDFDDL